jgi:adenylate cyclase
LGEGRVAFLLLWPGLAQEIERKFLVKGDAWRKLATGSLYRQGYLCSAVERTVRVRVSGNAGLLTIKGPTRGISRTELEYVIPLAHATLMLDTLCELPIIEKTRYTIPIDDYTWEVDEFHGENEGLVMAEVELDREDERPPLPDWLGEEVSHDARYYNANLVRVPFKRW